MNRKKNLIRTGLKSDKKVKESFYTFLYEKHIDWAIILAAFFSPLPYISSKSYWFLMIKSTIFLLTLFSCLQYILKWKKLYSYYEIYGKANQQIRALIDKDTLKQTNNEDYTKFNKDFTNQLKDLGKSYKESGEDSSFQDFLNKNPDKGQSLINFLNQNKNLTKSFFGGILGVLTSIFHLRSIPISELNNYRKLIMILILTILFFIVYAVETYFST
jgi:hypothetical protein